MIFTAVFFVLAVSGRMVALLVLRILGRVGAVPVAVYGAGAAGVQLISALRQASELHPTVLVDDNPALQGLLIAGLQVQPGFQLPDLAAKGRIKRVLVAMPSLSKIEQDRLLMRLQKLPCEVQVLPSYVDMIAGRGGWDQLKTVSPDALLGRDKVDLDTPEIASGLTVFN